jgi:hypothetical protein
VLGLPTGDIATASTGREEVRTQIYDYVLYVCVWGGGYTCVCVGVYGGRVVCI